MSESTVVSGCRSGEPMVGGGYAEAGEPDSSVKQRSGCAGGAGCGVCA